MILKENRLGTAMLASPAADESETDFEKMVVAYAQSLGWHVMAVRRNVCVQRRNSGETYNVTPWLYDGDGWPDLTLVRDRLIVIELKSEKGRLRPDQVSWLSRLDTAKVEHYVFRPSDLEEIERVLK